MDISITNGGYDPQVTIITVGTPVTWNCLEGVRETFTYTFDSTGVFSYYDTIYLWPLETIKVVHSRVQLGIRPDRTSYASGDTIRLGLDLTKPGDAVQVGILIWIEKPGGGITFLAKKQSLTIPAGFSYSDDEWLVTARRIPSTISTPHSGQCTGGSARRTEPGSSTL